MDAYEGLLADIDFLNLLQEGIWVANQEGKIIFVNEPLLRILGYESSEGLLGKIWRDFFPANEVTYLCQALSNELPEKIYRLHLITKNRRYLPVLVKFTPKVINGVNYYIGSVVYKSADEEGITEGAPKQIDLIAMVSHDLRIPLANVREAISLLTENIRNRLEEKELRYLDIAQEESERLNRMIDNLLEVAQMDSGKLTLHWREININQLIDTAINTFTLFINKKRLRVERNLSGETAPVLGDRDRLLRVLNNLLDNAIKYSPEGSTIRVNVDFISPSTTPKVGGISGAPNSSPGNVPCVQVTITDEGPGIPAEFLEQIFNKFERVDPHRPGLGLGLAIVRSIVELHQGRVWVRSTVGEGATFGFILPVAPFAGRPCSDTRGAGLSEKTVGKRREE